MARLHWLSMHSVTIGREIVERLLAEANATPDSESCGLLLGQDGAIAEARSAANVAADPARTFEIDPGALIAAHRAARSGGPVLIGCYHSHPRGNATPSPTDAAAAEPGALWLIIAGGSARLWFAEAGGFREVSLTVR